MKTKRILAIFLVLLLVAALLATFVACAKKSTDPTESEIIDDDDEKIVDKIEMADPDDGVKHKKAIIYVTALFGRGLYAPGQGWFPRYDRGYFHPGKIQLIISSGFAAHGSIPRVFNRPEFCVIHISPADPAEAS